jgi:hypothetical protein
MKVVEMFLGRRQPGATLAGASTPIGRCEALFFVGERQLLQTNRVGAIQSLKAAANPCPVMLMESKGARSELKRLGQ